jgi:hypothetical protein
MAMKKSSASDMSASPAATPAPRKRTGAAARPKGPSTSLGAGPSTSLGAGPSTSLGAGQNGDTRRDPTHDEIAEAAYHKYLSRHGADGSDFDDWVQAERDLRSRSTLKSQ